MCIRDSAMLCLVLTGHMLLPARCRSRCTAYSNTDPIPRSAISLRACYAMSGTNLAYAPTRTLPSGLLWPL
eukprot:403547-Rhodomonas_salina.1